MYKHRHRRDSEIREVPASGLCEANGWGNWYQLCCFKRKWRERGHVKKQKRWMQVVRGSEEYESRKLVWSVQRRKGCRRGGLAGEVKASGSSTEGVSILVNSISTTEFICTGYGHSRGLWWEIPKLKSAVIYLLMCLGY